MPKYKITMDFFMEASTAMEAFEWASGLDVVDEEDELIPREDLRRYVEFCVEEEIFSLVEEATATQLPDNVTRLPH